MSEPNKSEPDWKEIAMQLGKRLHCAATNGKFGNGLMMDVETMELSSIYDYFADGLEMIPGVKINRELLKMTPAQRRKHLKKKEPA